MLFAFFVGLSLYVSTRQYGAQQNSIDRHHRQYYLQHHFYHYVCSNYHKGGDFVEGKTFFSFPLLIMFMIRKHEFMEGKSWARTMLHK